MIAIERWISLHIFQKQKIPAGEKKGPPAALLLHCGWISSRNFKATCASPLCELCTLRYWHLSDSCSAASSVSPGRAYLVAEISDSPQDEANASHYSVAAET